MNDYERGRVDGAKAERERIVEYLDGIGEREIDDWGLNATGNIMALIKSNAHNEEKCSASAPSSCDTGEKP